MESCVRCQQGEHPTSGSGQCPLGLVLFASLRINSLGACEDQLLFTKNNLRGEGRVWFCYRFRGFSPWLLWNHCFEPLGSQSIRPESMEKWRGGGRKGDRRKRDTEEDTVDPHSLPQLPLKYPLLSARSHVSFPQPPSSPLTYESSAD